MLSLHPNNTIEFIKPHLPIKIPKNFYKLDLCNLRSKVKPKKKVTLIRLGTEKSKKMDICVTTRLSYHTYRYNVENTVYRKSRNRIIFGVKCVDRGKTWLMMCSPSEAKIYKRSHFKKYIPYFNEIISHSHISHAQRICSLLLLVFFGCLFFFFLIIILIYE